MKKLLQIILLLAGLAWCVPVCATGAYVGSIAVYGTSSSVATLTTGSYTATAGNVLVASTGYGLNTGTITSVQDVTNAANFTLPAGCLSQTTLTSNDTLQLGYLVVPSGGSTTYKVTFSTSQAFGHLYILEFSGIDTTTPFDVCTIATAVASVTSITSPAFTPSTNGGVNAFGVRWPGGTGTAVTAGANYTMRQSECSSGCITTAATIAAAIETRDNAPNSSQTAAMTWTTAKTAKGVVITLKVAAASTFRTQVGGFLVGP